MSDFHRLLETVWRYNRATKQAVEMLEQHPPSSGLKDIAQGVLQLNSLMRSEGSNVIVTRSSRAGSSG